jgi:hypothetical protein
MKKEFRFLLAAVIIGWCMALVSFSQADTYSNSIPGSDADPLVTRSYVDQIFNPLETKLNQLENRIDNLPKYETPTLPKPQDGIQVIVDGKLVNFPDSDPQPYINPGSDRILVPIRFIMETYGAQVDWSPIDKKVTMVKDGTKIELWIGKNTVAINGVHEITDQPPFLLSDRTIVPLRILSENLGYTVEWDPNSRSAHIRTQ